MCWSPKLNLEGSTGIVQADNNINSGTFQKAPWSHSSQDLENESRSHLNFQGKKMLE
jgi:hypothetical protein